MCGRFALTLPTDAVRSFFDAELKLDAAAEEAQAALLRPRHNIRPTQMVLAAVHDPARGARSLTPMRWGFLPHWYKAPNDGPLLINARGETVAEKPAFKKAVRERRCLIAADGFYEWRSAAGRGKEPYWVTPESGEPIAFAGVWRTWRPPVEAGAPDVAEDTAVGDRKQAAGASGPGSESGANRWIDTVAVITTEARGPLAEIHHREPVRVAPSDFGLWLGEDGHGAARLMRPAPPDFWRFWRVSTDINKSGENALDRPELRSPLNAEDDGAAERAPKPMDRLL